MRKIIVALMILVVMLSAAVVPVDRAKTVAQNYYEHYAPATNSSAVQNVLTKEYMGQPTWYVVQFTKGFVIVGADDNVRPVLGYSFSSPIDEDLYNMQNPFIARFTTFDKQIVHEIREQNIQVAEMQNEWKKIESKDFPSTKALQTAGPLLETTWGQNYPFNSQCPAGCPVGCVATGMAQIMRFHLGPETGAGSNSYNDLSGDTTGSHSVDFSTQTYDWSLMMTLNGATGGQDEVDELGKLNYHLGVSVNMDYNTDGSGAFMTTATTAYQNNWGFTGANRIYVGDTPAQNVYYATIMSNIDDNQPMEWAGTGAGGGHAYVMDGYNVDTIEGIYQYHFNWGWNGSYDGWYYLDDMTPGTSDFTLGQEFIEGLYIDGLLAQMPPPNNLQGSVDAQGNVDLTWDVPTTVDPMGTLIDYYIYRENEFIGAVGGTTPRAYTDEVLPEGSFDYVVRAIYENPDGNSLPTNVYSAVVVPDPNYPVPLSLTATSYVNNRSYIDLAWSKPFIGTFYVNDDFESNAHFDPPAGWWQKGSNDTYPNVNTWSDLDPGVGLPGFVSIHKDYYPQWVFQGNLSAGANGDGEEFTYTYMITDDSFTLPGGVGVVDYYTFYYAGTLQGVFLFSGTAGGSPSGNITPLRDYDTGDEAWAHDEVSLAAYSGTYRFGFYKLTIGGGSLLAFDNVILGFDSYPAGNQPTSYEIYNNGVFEKSVPVTGLTESVQSTDFTDGWNQYYVRAVYSGPEYSIASNKKSAWMDANPVPTYIEGAWDDINTECDLSWYAPGHYPPHYFGYEWENDSWNYLASVAGGGLGGGELQKARTYFTAEDFGMGYNIYIDEILTYWFEDVGIDDWSSDQFRIIIGIGDEGSETPLHTSAWQTADPEGYACIYALPSTQTITEDWYVEVELGDTGGTPTVITNVHEEGVDDDQWNSVWYWTGDGGSYEAGWYSYSYDSPYEFEDFAIYCYGYNDEPTITKMAPPAREPQEFTSLKANTAPRNEVAALGQPTLHRDLLVNHLKPAGKGLDGYNVYRNGAYYDYTTAKTYSDTSPLSGNEYYVTAVYSSPVGESDSTFHVIVGPPPVIGVPASIAESVPFESTDVGSFDISNTGLGDLNYTITKVYDGYLSQQVGVTFHSEDFASWPGTYTVVSNFTDGGGYAYLEGGKTPVSGEILSEVFDTSNATNVFVDFYSDFDFSGGGAVAVNYYDGASWTEIYATGSDATGTQHIEITGVGPNTQLQFIGTGLGRQGSNASWQIDDISVTGDLVVPYTWLTITSSLTGTVTPSSSNQIDYSIDTAGLTDGLSYDCDITVTSNDPGSPDVIPMTLTVEAGGTLEAPVLNAPTINGANIEFTWPAVSGATSYNVYTSADPYGTFTLTDNTGTNSYSAAYGDKLFYYFTSTDAKTAAPKTIYIAKPKSVR